MKKANFSKPCVKTTIFLRKNIMQQTNLHYQQNVSLKCRSFTWTITSKRTYVQGHNFIQTKLTWGIFEEEEWFSFTFGSLYCQHTMFIFSSAVFSMGIYFLLAWTWNILRIFNTLRCDSVNIYSISTIKTLTQPHFAMH